MTRLRLGWYYPMQHIRNLVLDMDGVLWHGENANAGIAGFLMDCDGSPLATGDGKPTMRPK